MNLSRYSDVTWASWCLKSWSTRLLFQQVAEAQQRKHQSSALYALLDPPVSSLVCCHIIMQFKSLTEKFDFKWRHIWSNSLKHWGRAKMADIFQTTFFKALYWMKMYKLMEIPRKFVPGGPSIGSNNNLAQRRRQAFIWTNDDLFTDAYMRHSTSVS